MNRIPFLFCLLVLLACESNDPDLPTAPENGIFSLTLQGESYSAETQGTYTYDPNFQQSQVEMGLVDPDLTVVKLTLASEERDENFFTEGTYPNFGDKSSGIVVQIFPDRNFFAISGSAMISESDTVIDVISGNFSYTLAEFGDTTNQLQISGSFDELPVK